MQTFSRPSLDTGVSSFVPKERPAEGVVERKFFAHSRRRRKRTYGREELSAEAFPHKADLSLHEHIDYEGVWLVVRTADRKLYLMSP